MSLRCECTWRFDFASYLLLPGSSLSQKSRHEAACALIAAARSSGDTGVSESANRALGLAPRLRSAMHLSSPTSHSLHATRVLGTYGWLFLLARISALRSGVMEVVNHGPPDTPEPGSNVEPGSIASAAIGMRADIANRRPIGGSSSAEAVAIKRMSDAILVAWARRRRRRSGHFLP